MYGHFLQTLKRQFIFGLCLFGLVAGAQAQTSERFDFQVMLDEREIGFHSFRVNQFENYETVDIQANFKVTFFAIPLYRYGHQNQEVWRNGCLESIESRTDDNGDNYRVEGQREAAGFLLTTETDRMSLDRSCVMTFSYWNMDMLEQDRLLNAQNGEYLPVQIEFEGSEVLQLGEDSVDAIRYRMRSPEHDVDITVWYDQSTRRWLSLESRTKDGHKIRYWPTTTEAAMQSAYNFESDSASREDSQR